MIGSVGVGKVTIDVSSVSSVVKCERTDRSVNARVRGLERNHWRERGRGVESGDTGR